MAVAWVSRAPTASTSHWGLGRTLSAPLGARIPGELPLGWALGAGALVLQEPRVWQMRRAGACVSDRAPASRECAEREG